MSKKYEQDINWNTPALYNLNEVLILDVKNVIIQFRHDNFKTSIKTNNTLGDIMTAVQTYFNQVKENDSRTRFYITDASIIPLSLNEDSVKIGIWYLE